MEPTNFFQVEVKGYPNIEYIELLPDGVTLAFKDTSMQQILSVPLEDVIGCDQLNDDTINLHLFTKES